MRQTRVNKRQSITDIHELLHYISHAEAALARDYKVADDMDAFIEELRRMDEEMRELEGWKYYIAVGYYWAIGSANLWDVICSCIGHHSCTYLIEIEKEGVEDGRPLYTLQIERF